jgi:O-antigen/teichoic acid export membrane protein
MEQGSNRTIARNTLMLYARSILMMVIGLYTSRVILRALGITDFGIYNAVGGVVGMLGFISSSLSNATSRFITIAIGGGDQEYINRTFGNIKIIYYSLSLIVVLLGETIGIWFLYTQMTIPSERMTAAFWVYQYSILSTVLFLICVPYNSVIIAHERMSAFAYISLFDALMKLGICYLLLITPYDRLILYATLIVIVEIIDRGVYTYYCQRHFEESHVKAKVFKTQFRELISFSGWTISGNIAWICNTQGVNLILNVFFGPVVNAARGIAMQVQGIVTQFITNFQTAINPQITKSLSNDNYTRVHSLLKMSSKFSYYLLLLMSVPLIFEAPFVLELWLGIVPDITVSFLRIILVATILKTLSNPLWTSVLATGKLKKYMMYDNAILLMILPCIIVLFKFFSVSAIWAFITIVIAEVMALIVRIWIVLPLIRLKYIDYYQSVILPVIGVTVLSPLAPMWIYTKVDESIGGFIIVTSISIMLTCVTIWGVGLTMGERKYIADIVKQRLVK